MELTRLSFRTHSRVRGHRGIPPPFYNPNISELLLIRVSEEVLYGGCGARNKALSASALEAIGCSGFACGLRFSD